MLAAENAAVAGAKVGGMADVIGDLPAALHNEHVAVDVMMPSYGFLVSQLKARFIADVSLPFRGQTTLVKVFIAPHPNVAGSAIYLLDHPHFDAGGAIYTSNNDGRPFADDADKFALMCAAAAQVICQEIVDKPDVLHLHDWHCGVLALLRAYEPRFNALQAIHTVYSVHNLSIQGQRPLCQEHSSLQAWFPELFAKLSVHHDEAMAKIIDPIHAQCFNPMRAAINLCDHLHFVSPTYAKEVLLASDSGSGHYGGEGLQDDIAQRAAELRVHGILNGCFYHDAPLELPKRTEQDFAKVLDYAEQCLLNNLASNQWVASQDQIALQRLNQLRRAAKAPSCLLTSVGRLTSQKVALLLQVMADGRYAIEHLLQSLATGQSQGVLILLGSGDEHIEQQLRQVAGRWPQLLFINGFDLPLSQLLYQHGDLFMMPSSFEPCGISQMLAMKAGQPCIVHGVGGLKDTIEHQVDGWVFNGDSLADKVDAMLATVTEAVAMTEQPQFQSIRQQALANRFTWQDVAKAYCEELYEF
ncbi:glycogen synthase [Shewanella sp. Scap07]|nr:glycogen synthase [Shewanella sp. Scap07]